MFLGAVSYILCSGTEYGYLILGIYKIHATGAKAEKQGFLRCGAGCVFVFSPEKDSLLVFCSAKKQQSYSDYLYYHQNYETGGLLWKI